MKDNTVILDNSNIVESYPGITLPLTASFVEDAYSGVFSNILYKLTGSKKIATNSKWLMSMVRCYNGRMYYQISNWYKIINYFPFSGKIIKIWQEMLGVNNKSVSVLEKISFVRKIIVFINILIMAQSVPRKMRKLEEHFNEVNEYFYHNYNERLNNSQLLSLYDTLQNKVLKSWDITLANDMYAFIFTYLAKDRSKSSAKLISSVANLESIKPIRELALLTKMAVDDNNLEILKRLKNKGDTLKYLNTDSKMASNINSYIQLYGDRYLEELKLESQTYRTNPELLISKIISYSINIDDVNKLINSHSSNLPEHRSGIFFKKAVSGIRNREISRLNRSRLYGMVRTIFNSIARNLVNSGSIDSMYDINYLTIDEIMEYVKNNTFDLKKIITSRKAEYKNYLKISCKNRIILSDGAPENSDIKKIKKTKIIIGTPVSSGTIIAEVIVIEDPLETPHISGKILVTKTTDPGWVFLMVSAKGIISEKGSLLSHTAIIARELGVPAVVGVDNITKILKTGDKVKLNGESGIIEILS